MANANTESYSEVISMLSSFLTEADGYCQTMETAAQTCVDNMEEDPNAQKASGKVSECTTAIRQNFDALQDVINAMQEELGDVNDLASYSFD
ncbi:MAG: hypothetical protein K6A37_04300 [Saccharofermentans sp.]|nr:hypothetical protein [Saccharofermentans sp.]